MANNTKQGGGILENLLQAIANNAQQNQQYFAQGNQQQAMQPQVAPTAEQAGQVAAQQVAPPVVKKEKVSADGKEVEYFSPQELQPQPVDTAGQQPTATKAPEQGQPTARSIPKGPGGVFYPGSDTEQPGAIYKVLTMLAGGGAYKPSTENATLQMTALSGRYQTAKALQDKESELQRNLITQAGQILQANPVTAYLKGININGMLNNVNQQLTASQQRYEEANAELSGVLSSYQERMGKSMQAAEQTSQQIQEGQTATNQKTGKKIVWRQGKWQPTKTTK